MAIKPDSGGNRGRFSDTSLWSTFGLVVKKSNTFIWPHLLEAAVEAVELDAFAKEIPKLKLGM